MCLACTECDSHTLSSAVTSCDSWLKVGSSGPVVPDQPGETLEIHGDRGKRTWWHPPCHPLSHTASCTVDCLSQQPPVSPRPLHWLQSTPIPVCSLLVFISGVRSLGECRLCQPCFQVKPEKFGSFSTLCKLKCLISLRISLLINWFTKTDQEWKLESIF